ncbi:ankyrin repeat domain-containing protein 17 isoform X1 [Patella vulgata]|uniref:ankyrin repeat domain-containing protein 17 isoform X1 n=1 Tax=Patella vulgata TaxID=6465 RepID=UPI0024A93FAE|nr:ankyrin repeat domain-containing protein 17 isoform X1 [Patella vulgata]
MMQNVAQTKANEIQDVRRVEIDENSQTPSLENPGPGEINDPSSVFVAETSSEEDEPSEVDSFTLDESADLDDDQILEPSQFLLQAETGDPEALQAVDPETHARLEALLEAAGISKLSSKDGKALTDPEVLRTLTSSVSSALDEAAQALHRMRQEHQGQICTTADGTRAITEAGENDVGGIRSKFDAVAFPEPIDGEGEGESLLSLACSAGYYELAQVLLAMKANVEDRGIKGDCTPLMEAASGGHADIVRLLIAHSADVNAQSSAGNTPLHYAACGGYVEVVKELIKAYSNVEVHNENGHTPLMEAASAGHVEVAKTLLLAGAGINTHSNEFKESALTLACYKGHLDMVKYLLEAGADREHKTDEMHTALMEASMDGHVEVARLLLDNGAQVNMPADSFESPLTLAACGGHVELACLLLERGANIEEVNDEGYTPLMEAAREGHEDMVALLLAHDADINAQTEETQETALTLACCGGFLEVADFIIKAGADIELGCSTPLMEASQEGHLELVKYLLKCLANVHAQTGTGDTALTYACENGHTDVAEVLLDADAELEHESEGGRTPLMKAARAGHLATVQFLISKGADLNRATSTNDHTVLSLACAGGHMTVVELLLGQVADPNHRLKDGSTMIIEAAKGGHTNVVKLLLEWPNRQLSNLSPDSTQLNAIDLTTEEPRVPLPGLVNIVPPSEPDPQSLNPANYTPNIQAKTVDQLRTNLQKCVAKRSLNPQPDNKVIKQINNPAQIGEITPVTVNPDKKGTEQYPNEKATEKVEAIINTIMAKELNSVPAASKEEQIQRKQQILAELQKVERELHEKAQQQREQQQHRDQQQQQQVIARIRQAANVTAGVPDSSTLLTPTSTDINTLGVQTDLPFSDLMLQNPKLPKSLPELPVVSQPVMSYGDTYVPQPIFTANSNANSNITDTRAPAAGKNAQTKRNGNVKARSKSIIGVIQPPVTPPIADQNGVTSSTDPPTLVNPPCVSQQQLSTTTTIGTVGVVDQVRQQPLQVQNPQNLQFPQFQLTPQQQGQLLQHMLNNGLQSQNFSPALPQQALQLLPQAPLPQSPLVTSQALSQVQLAQAQASLGHQNQLVQNTAISQSLQLSGQPTNILNQTMLVQQASTLQLAQQSLQTVAPTPVSQQFFTQQQQQQFLHQQQALQQLQQQQPQQIQPQQIQLQQVHQQLEQMKQQQQQPQHPQQPQQPVNNKQIYRKQQLLVQQNQNGQTLVQQSSSILGVEAITPPPSTPLTPTPSPASPHSLPPSSLIDVDAHTESNHDTALTLACAGGHAELVTLLLAKNATLEHRDKKGFTPLILAATAGHVDVVEILLDHRADIEAQSERTKDTPLSLACSGGRYEVVELLLARGANKEHRNVSDYTPLSLAASGGYVNIIKLLLNHGAEINSRTGSKLGISPLMLAAMNGHLAAVKLLLDMGSDINAQIETNRNTALTLACFQGRHEVVSLLVDRKANIEHRAKTGLTPLMEAASGGYVEVGQVLIDKGADVNAPPVPSSRDTALTIAADKGHYKFVELLIIKNCQIEVKNKKGNSPLWLACAGGHLDVAQLLVQNSASIDSMDNRKVSCLMASFRKGHTKIVKWLVKLVSQFPSDPELQKYIATVSDKELQQRCEQCMEAIISAKNWQAEEANKNATILLEELDKERQELENKKAVQAKKRERKRMKNKKKNIKDINKKEDECKYSSPEPDSSESAHNEVEKIEQEIVKLIVPVATTTSTIGTTLPTTTEPTVARNRKTRVAPTSSLEARKNRKNRREERERQLEKRNAIPKTSCNWKSVATTTLTITTTANVITTVSMGAVTSTTTSSSSSGGRVKKNDLVYRSNHNTGIGDLDDFGTIPPSMKLPDKEIQKLTKKLDKIKINNVTDKTATAGSHNNLGSKVNQSTSPKKGQKKEEGWKEVVRKMPCVSRLKKVSVPANAISRVIGRGGCNINAIRDVSGAHVEVEKQKGMGERSITIKGSLEATRQAHALITALVQDPEKELAEIIGETKAELKADKPPVIDTFSADMPIGTFNAASVSHNSANSNAPVKSSGTRSNEARQGMGTPTHAKVNSQPPMSVSMWQDPNPTPLASPRKSPQKLFMNPPPSSGPMGYDKNGIQIYSERHQTPVVTVSTTTVSHNNNQGIKVMVTTTSTITGQRVDNRPQMSGKMPNKTQPTPGPIRLLQRPGTTTKSEHQPLPIVTSHASHAVTSSQQHAPPVSPATTPGEYSPFNTFISNVFMKKEEDKMNFASVAKAGVVSTSTNMINNSHPSGPIPNDHMMDPALQAKAPGYKLGRTASPQFRQEQELQVPTIRNFHIPINNMNPMTEHDFSRAPGYPSMISPRSNNSTPSGLSPRNHGPMEMNQQSLAALSTSQKAEYSTPNQPMTLPEIKSTLNPNAPDFHLAGNQNSPIMENMGMGIPPNLQRSPRVPPMHGNPTPTVQQSLLLLNANNLNMLSQKADIASIIQQLASHNMNPGSGAFNPPPPVQQIQRALSPMMPQLGRPNSAPSIGTIQERPAPVNEVKPSLEDRRVPRPIGVERAHRKAPGRSSLEFAAGRDFGKLWEMNQEVNHDWVPSTTHLMTAASMSSSVMTSSVITGGNMVYNLNSLPGGGPPTNDTPHERTSYHENIPQLDPNLPQTASMVTMFANGGVPGHYPPNQHMMAPRMSGDNLPNLWNSGIKQPTQDSIENGTWAWSQQGNM